MPFPTPCKIFYVIKNLKINK
jgi:hypothetical protein